MTFNNINKIFCESGELSSKFLIRRKNQRLDRPDIGRYKIIADNTNKLFKLNVKSKLHSVIDVLDYNTAKFGLEKEHEEFLRNIEILLCFYLCSLTAKYTHVSLRSL